MNQTSNSLALRRQSIRTLSPAELSIAHGGEVKTGTCIPTRTTNRTK
jgi:hypothetical protein